MAKAIRVRQEGERLIATERADIQTGDEIQITLLGTAGTDAKAMDLYEVEYKELQEHYRDGYRAVWSNFQYISVAVGAILGLGARTQVPIELLVLLGSALYLFWWIATFSPLDTYGERRADLLSAIEQNVNSVLGKPVWTHWTTLNEFRRNRWWRVKNVVNRVFGPLILIIFAISLWHAYPLLMKAVKGGSW